MPDQNTTEVKARPDVAHQVPNMLTSWLNGAQMFARKADLKKFNPNDSWVYEREGSKKLRNLGDSTDDYIDAIVHDLERHTKTEKFQNDVNGRLEKFASPTPYDKEQARLEVLYDEMNVLFNDVLNEKYNKRTDYELAEKQAQFFEKISHNFPESKKTGEHIPKEIQNNLTSTKLEHDQAKAMWKEIRQDASLTDIFEGMNSKDKARRAASERELIQLANSRGKSSVIGATKMLSKDGSRIVNNETLNRITKLIKESQVLK